LLATAQAVAREHHAAANLVVVVGHGADQVRAAFSDRNDVRFVLQQPQRGTGHAVQQAVPSLRDDAPTLVLYGDVPLVRVETLGHLIAGAGDGVGLLTVTLIDPTGYGRIVRDDSGAVRRIVEQRDADPHERALREVNTGILVAPTVALKRWLSRLSDDNAQREYYLTDVIAMAVGEGVRVSAIPVADADETLGVNSKAQLAVVERIAQRRAAEDLMESGVTLADPARIDVRGDLRTGTDVSIDVGCVFEGRVQLGNDVTIGPYCVLRDVTVGARTQVLAFSHLERTTVGCDARIGPFSRTRPGAVLDDEVHIGNFVEIKASRLARGAKANHLAYVGDAAVGARTNIGAGTITANYDGANKHRTEIGSDVSIGSNAVLVAPVTVGDGATVGAGSVVAKVVPAGKLTVARARQVTVEGWKRPVKKKKGAPAGS
jgi:bifunctional UDP-N-acetylglucosamine pyrophosphorylase/glucosamine-1-phosphate N-acetyltransferase